MDDTQLHTRLIPLLEAQITYTYLIKIGLSIYQPDDECMAQLFEAQDEIYSQVREIIAAWPAINALYLEDFDRLLHDVRINVLLSSQRITPSKR